MKRIKAFGLKDGMTIVEVIISMVLIAITVLVVTTVAGGAKERCVRGENLQEANKLAMFVLEDLLPLEYTDAMLNITTPPDIYAVTLPACNLTNRCPGTTGSYTVTEAAWGTGTENNYKRIKVTINWEYNGQPQSVSFGTLKGQEGISTPIEAAL